MEDTMHDFFKDFVEEVLTEDLCEMLPKWFDEEKSNILIELDNDHGLEVEIREIVEEIPDTVSAKVLGIIRKAYDNKKTISILEEAVKERMSRTQGHIQADIKHTKDVIRQQRFVLKEYERELQERP